MADDQAQSIAGTEWVVDEIAGAAVLPGTPPSLLFGADGRAAGSGGVNRIGGPYELGDDGATITFGPFISTMMAGPPERMDQERRLLVFLAGRLGLRRDGDSLELTGPEGVLRLHLARPAASSVTGSVFYRERIAMPAGSVVTVRLQDVSRADAPAGTIAEQVIERPGNVPVRFELTFDPSAIDERHTYSVSARIDVEGELAWISDSHHPVLTRGAPSTAEIMVVRVSPGE